MTQSSSNDHPQARLRDAVRAYGVMAGGPLLLFLIVKAGIVFSVAALIKGQKASLTSARRGRGTGRIPAGVQTVDTTLGTTPKERGEPQNAEGDDGCNTRSAPDLVHSLY